MIRVDSLESYKELRESGYAGDILVLMKGGDDVGKEADDTDGKDTDETEAVGKKDEADNGTEAGRVQLDYEKIIDGVTEKIKPLIQKQNRDAGTGAVKDETLDDIMAKFADM